MSNYVTVAELRSFRPIGSTAKPDLTSFNNDELQQILNEAEAQVETATNNIFNTRSYDFILDGNGKKKLFLFVEVPYKIQSITSVTEVEFDGEVLFTFEPNIHYQTEEYALVLDQGYRSYRSRLRAGVWPKGLRNIRVQGEFGMATTPEQIKRAVKMLAIANSIGPQNAGIGIGGSSDQDVVQENWSDYTVTYRGSTPSSSQRERGVANLTGFIDIDRLLSPYINHVNMFLAV